MFDYEWASVQHHVNCRLARAVVVPDAIPPERLQPYGADGKIRAYPGLKEEYYLADFVPDPAILAELALDPARPIAVIRTPPEVSLYHRFANDLFADVLAARPRRRRERRASRSSCCPAPPTSAPSWARFPASSSRPTRSTPSR